MRGRGSWQTCAWKTTTARPPAQRCALTAVCSIFLRSLPPSYALSRISTREDGLWACENGTSINPLVVSQTAEFVTGLVKGEPGRWAIKAGNATGGPLVKSFEGPRPRGYAPMRKQASVAVGIGGDNSDSAISVWFEGVMTAGYSEDATDDLIQADITRVYGAH